MLFLNIVLPVFLIVAVGFFAEKAGRFDFRTLTNCSLYLFSPALVFSAIFKHHIDPGLTLDLILFMVIYTTLLLALAALVGRLLRMETESRSALALTTAMMNVGNFGLPLVYFAFGKGGLEISILTFVVFNIPLGTVAIYIAQGGRSSARTMLKNTAGIPIFHAVVLAFFLKWLEIPLPEFILRPIDLIGQAAIPLMLVMLGMQLARTRLQASPAFLGISSGIRLILAPLIAWILCELLHIPALARNVLILQTSTPSAVLPLLYALRFGTRPDLVAGGILVSTLLSSVTLTILLYLLQ